MANLTVQYDPIIKLPVIEKLLSTPSPEELPDVHTPNENAVQQTRVDGIMAPLVVINSMKLSYDQIEYFELTSNSILPTLKLIVIDTMNLIETIESPKNDNSIQIQILPPFDNAYKKINLLFYITGYKSLNGKLHIDAVYNIPHLYDSHLEPYGKMTTQEICDKVAKDLQLGFVTNVQSNEDERYIYSNNNTYIDLLNKEVRQGGGDRSILQWWVDWRNNLTLCDVYERYTSMDGTPEIWVSSIDENTDEPTAPKTSPVKTKAIATNTMDAKKVGLYISNYTSNLKTGNNVNSGTDKVVLTYDLDRKSVV